MKKHLIGTAIALAMFSTNSLAITIPQNDKTNLNIFFSASTPSNPDLNYVPPIPELTLARARVVSPKSCKGNLGLSISNAFTDGTLKKIFDNFSKVLEDLASPEGAMYLGALYLSKTNPNLYQLITEGFQLTIDDYLSAMGSCEAIAQSLVDRMPTPSADDEMKDAAQRSAFAKLHGAIERGADRALDWNKMKVEDVVTGGLDKLAERGITLWGNENKEGKAGKNQNPLAFINDTITYGWCVYRGFSKDECEKFYTSSNVGELIGSTDYEKLIFDTKQGFVEVAVFILGEEYLSICEGCSSISVSGRGIQAYIEREQAKVFNAINGLSQKPIRNISQTEYNAVSMPPAIQADANYFRNLALLESDAQVRNMYAKGWAYDVAYQRAQIAMDLVEKSLFGLTTEEKIVINGLEGQTRRMIDDLNRQRELLDRNSRRNSYTPRMYVLALLGAGQMLSEGRLPSGLEGRGL